MRFLLWLIAVFALAAGVAMLAGSNDGLVQIVLPRWHKQIVLSLNFALVLLLSGFILGYFLLRLISSALDLPGRVGLYRARRQQEKAFTAFKEAVRALFESRFSAAVQYAKQAYRGDKAPVTALVAARAFHGLHDEKRYREWLEKAEQNHEGQTAALLTQAEFALADRDVDEGANALSNLQQSGYHGDSVSKLALEIALLQKRWNEIPTLVERLLSHKLLTADEARPLLRRTHVEQLRAMADDPQSQASYWSGLSKTDLADTALLVEALPSLARAGQGKLARRAVERALDSEWNSDLAAIYPLTVDGSADTAAALSQAEEWLRKHSQDSGLLYALGALCLSSQLWGKAEAYLRSSLESRETPQAHGALAELMERTGRADEALAHYRVATAACTDRPPMTASPLPVAAT